MAKSCALVKFLCRNGVWLSANVYDREKSMGGMERACRAHVHVARCMVFRRKADVKNVIPAMANQLFQNRVGTAGRAQHLHSRSGT